MINGCKFCGEGHDDECWCSNRNDTGNDTDVNMGFWLDEYYILHTYEDKLVVNFCPICGRDLRVDRKIAKIQEECSG